MNRDSKRDRRRDDDKERNDIRRENERRGRDTYRPSYSKRSPSPLSRPSQFKNE
jgi:hypothetical protein